MTKDQLQTIEYVKGHLQNWMLEQNILPFRNENTELIERIVRVEEGIKHQNKILEKMMFQYDNRFGEINNRFGEMNNRFTEFREDMDKRFNRQGQFLIVIFAAIVSSAVAMMIQLN